MVTEHRVKLAQLPDEVMQKIWRDFEPSDYERHRRCGYIPTGEKCHVCNKKLGNPLKEPYSYQDKVLADDHLTIVISGGEQVGKSYTGAMKAYKCIMAFIGEYKERAHNEVAWLVGDSYEQTAREFEYLKTWFKQTAGLNILKEDDRVDPGEIHISVPNGGVFKIKTKSSKDAMASLRMESPVVVLICEAAICSFDTYTRIRSRVGRARADFPGYGSIIMISTFEGSVGWFPTLWQRGQLPATREKENIASFSMPSHSNIFVYKRGERDPQILAIKADVSEDEFKERILAIPSPPKGRVFQSFDPTIHILPENPKYDPEKPVFFGIDPGYSGQPSHYAVEAIQERELPCGNKHYQGIDEIYTHHVKNEGITTMAQNRFWWSNPDKKGVIDVASRSHAGAEDPAREVWRKHTGMVLLSERVAILPGIRRMDSMLNLCVNPSCGQPVLVFAPSMEGVIGEFSGLPHPKDGCAISGESRPYKWPTDRSGQVTVGHLPEDAYCDGIKALTYLFINMLGHTLTGTARKKIRVKKRKRERDEFRRMMRAS